MTMRKKYDFEFHEVYAGVVIKYNKKTGKYKWYRKEHDTLESCRKEAKEADAGLGHIFSL